MTQVEELGGNRVRLTVDVSPHELEHAVEHAASDLARLRPHPGLPQGEGAAPGAARERRQGSALGGGRRVAHRRLVLERGRAVRGCGRSRRPQYDFELPASEAEPWTFSATVEVQPTPEIVDWTTLEVPRQEAEIPEELVQAELDALRGSIAELAPADDRPAQEGDTLVVDLAGAQRRRASRTRSSSSAPVGSSPRSSRRSSAPRSATRALSATTSATAPRRRSTSP